MDAVLTMTPRSPSSPGSVRAIAAAASRSTLNVPTRLTMTVRVNGASPCGDPSRFTVRSAQPMPAQLIAMRNGRSLPVASSIAACADVSSVTSVRTKVVCPPSSLARACPRSSWRSRIVTAAPRAASARAVASPRPEAPPVTTAATSKFCMFGTLMGRTQGPRAMDRTSGDAPHAKPAHRVESEPMSRTVWQASEQDPACAGVDEGKPGRRRRQDRRKVAAEGSGRRSWWTAFAVLSLLGGLWSVADPVFSVPDEPAHAVYAVAAVRGQLSAPTKGVDTIVTVPATYANPNTAASCFIFAPTVPAGCAERLLARSGDAHVVTTAGRYPPAYYLYVGSATLLADGTAAIYLMRLLTVLACAALLASAFSSARRSRSPWPV